MLRTAELVTIMPGKEEAFNAWLEDARNILAKHGGASNICLLRPFNSAGQYVILADWPNPERIRTAFRQREVRLLFNRADYVLEIQEIAQNRLS